MLSSPPTPDERARLAAAVARAGFLDSALDGAVRVANSVFRIEYAGRTYAAKLFGGTAADERLRTETAAYARLAAGGAPVPQILAEASEPRVLVREWARGRPLSDILRDEATGQAPALVARGWADLQRATATRTQSLAARRRRGARARRLAELRAVATAVVVSPVLHDLVGGWDRAAREVESLPDAIAQADLAVLPLDLAPANVIVGTAAAMFIDLEILGIDFSPVALCKATMLPHDRRGGGAGRMLFGSPAALDVLPVAAAEFAAAALLLALADAAGVWHNGVVDAATALILPRAVPRLTPNAQRIGHLLD